MARAEVGARERKKRATRAQLEEAAYSLFAQRGYDATTVDEIAEAAQVSPRTFFRYFATKEDVVFPDSAWLCDQIRSVMETGPASDTAVVANAVVAFSQLLEKNREGTLARRQLINDNPALEGRRLLIESEWVSAVAGTLAVRAGRESPTFEQQVLAGCAICALSTAVQHWHATGAAEPLPVFTRRALGVAGLPTG